MFTIDLLELAFWNANIMSCAEQILDTINIIVTADSEILTEFDSQSAGLL